MRQLRAFLPWITYSVASALVDWRVGAAVALGASVVALVRGGANMFLLAATAFFGALSTIALIDPTSGLHRYVPALVPATLAVAAAISILATRPFTIEFAKRVAPREYWDTPMFMHINIVLTGVWAASFAITAAVVGCMIAIAPHAYGILLGAQIAGFVVPMRISRIYPASVRARYASAS